jgi:L-2-hydroxyglutarate oxidase LhgO
MRPTRDADAVIVGAGVVGLAVARALALRGLDVLVLERHRRPGEEISSRNSGVIHAGIYYPADSLKARLCVQGRELLYQYCSERDIAHRRCGKIIVAAESQITSLRQLRQRGEANGVTDLMWLTADEVRGIEPAVSCAAALLSPSTGIIDVHELITSLQGDLDTCRATLAFGCELHSVTTHPEGFTLAVRSGGESSEIRTGLLVNCAGLEAVALLKQISGYPADRRHDSYLAKGNYFACQGLKPFTHLVYPMPNDAGLGIHATLDLDGSVRFGPDVEWITSVNYDVDPGRARVFYSAIHEYWPALPQNCLQPAYAGIRPKLAGPGMKAQDFEIEGPGQHGVPGLMNLLGIESPGLTCCMAIGAEVARQLLDSKAP